MSIGVKAIEGSRYSYEVAALSHPGEILKGIARVKSAQPNKILTPEEPILLFEGQNVILNQRGFLHISTVAGKGSLEGGVLIRAPEEYLVEPKKYFAGYGLLIFGFLNLEDLYANYSLLPRIESDEIRQGSW